MYASCLEQPCQHFFAVAAAMGLVVTIGDTTNAFQQSPLPTQKCFLQIDDAIWSWYRKCHNKDIDPSKYVIPLECALQGYPEAGSHTVGENDCWHPRGTRAGLHVHYT